jgi:hypothetical protein
MTTAKDGSFEVVLSISECRINLTERIAIGV